MALDLKVDCTNLKITLTLQIWVGPNFPNQHIRAIRNAIRNLNPIPQPYFFRCRVLIKVKISQAQRKPRHYDHFELTPPSPQGGGSTLQPAGGQFSPTSVKFIGISPLPNGTLDSATISHELGHAMGINDPIPTTKWDRDGIKESHIQEIFDNGSIRLPDGRLVGWHSSAHCCRATHQAKTERETGD